jgi:DNA-binding SARP family transcriptional activator
VPRRYQPGITAVDRYQVDEDTGVVGGISILGPLSVDEVDGTLGPRDRVVLAVLTLRPGEVVPAERLADALWGDDLPASWNKVVQGCVVRIRKALGSDAVETAPSGYRLALPADAIDAHRFERLSRRGHELLTLGQPEHAAHIFGEALALWRGPALADLQAWSTGQIEAERLHELRLDAEEAWLDATLRAGRGRDVVARAQAHVAEAPLRERRWALLALAQYQAGSQGDALRTLHRARAVLAAELGLDPGPDLVEVEQAILRQDEGLVVAAPPPSTVDACPYRGLLPYDVGDADSFFGREEDAAAGLRRLATTGVLAVVGPSGSGKSS